MGSVILPRYVVHIAHVIVGHVVQGGRQAGRLVGEQEVERIRSWQRPSWGGIFLNRETFSRRSTLDFRILR